MNHGKTHRKEKDPGSGCNNSGTERQMGHNFDKSVAKDPIPAPGTTNSIITYRWEH